jgi:hypothetical protein
MSAEAGDPIGETAFMPPVGTPALQPAPLPVGELVRR